MSDLPTPTSLRRQLGDIKELAALPHVMARIEKLANDPRAGADEVGKEIAKDQGLTTRILKVANSAYYGQTGHVVTIPQAVVLLGLDEVRRLSLAISVLAMFQDDTFRSQDRLDRWLHAFHTAAMAEIIDRDRGGGNAGAFTAGLLHDVGRAVLDQHFPALYEHLRDLETQTGNAPAAVELEVLECDHGEIGYWLAQLWHFPADLGEAIRYHHQPSNAVHAPRLTAVVHVANALAHRLQDEHETAAEQHREIHPFALAELDLVPSEMPRFLDRLAGVIVAGDALVRELVGFHA